MVFTLSGAVETVASAEDQVLIAPLTYPSLVANSIWIYRSPVKLTHHQKILYFKHMEYNEAENYIQIRINCTAASTVYCSNR